MVESTLKGETIELAAAFELKERLDNSETIDAVALIIREACEAGMLTSMEEARKNLQARAVDTGDYPGFKGCKGVICSYQLWRYKKIPDRASYTTLDPAFSKGNPYTYGCRLL
jgi:predicted DNA-binding protein